METTVQRRHMPKPYLIYSPPFDITSGGIRVMYGLYGWLLAKGQVAFMNQRHDGPSIAIYPEIVRDNPLFGSKVVRYLLNKPGAMALYGVQGPTEYPEEDMLVSFSKLYADTPINLFLPILDLHTFKVTNKGKREKVATLTGKHTEPVKIYGDLLDREFASNQQQLADKLNECQVLYCYDPNTAMTEIARLCGCRVVVIPSKYSKEEFQKYEPGMNGISWGLEEEILLDVEAFRDHYIGLVDKFSTDLDKFIEVTQHD